MWLGKRFTRIQSPGILDVKQTLWKTLWTEALFLACRWNHDVGPEKCMAQPQGDIARHFVLSDVNATIDSPFSVFVVRRLYQYKKVPFVYEATSSSSLLCSSDSIKNVIGSEPTLENREGAQGRLVQRLVDQLEPLLTGTTDLICRGSHSLLERIEEIGVGVCSQKDDVLFDDNTVIIGLQLTSNDRSMLGKRDSDIDWLL
ncbi:hypothetical protein OS493_026830 [Desmophyllum pertusum]|uniref:Uncharacterized protein n=1 Tax=Desmophyllum pertusum TaxID=174260 RepID=A0A9W9ZMI4_9CNID|nr:hypothetical protein OS493_026830 [Desmophyllum pertusum]